MNKWWNIALPLTTWLEIAAWLAGIGWFIIVFLHTDWGIVFTLIALILAWAALSHDGEDES